MNEEEEKDLNQRVGRFIEWYKLSITLGKNWGIEEKNKIDKMRNFIEKMAVCYELLYPDYELEEMIELNTFNGYKRLQQQQELVKLYNKFSDEEKEFLTSYKYSDVVCINSESKVCQFYINTDGIIEETLNIEEWSNFKLTHNEIEGLYLKDAVKIIKKNNVVMPGDNQLEKEIRKADRKMYQIEEMLDCVMYRLIERGGKNIGPYRAFIYALDFEKDIDIPMKYGMDLDSSEINKFINRYLENGGSSSLLCYSNYFDRINKDEKLELVSLARVKETLEKVEKESNYEITKDKLFNLLANKSSKDREVSDSIRRFKTKLKR